MAAILFPDLCRPSPDAGTKRSQAEPSLEPSYFLISAGVALSRCWNQVEPSGAKAGTKLFPDLCWRSPDAGTKRSQAKPSLEPSYFLISVDAPQMLEPSGTKLNQVWNQAVS